MKVSGILRLMHPTVKFIESCYGCSQYKIFYLAGGSTYSWRKGQTTIADWAHNYKFKQITVYTITNVL